MWEMVFSGLPSHSSLGEYSTQRTGGKIAFYGKDVPNRWRKRAESYESTSLSISVSKSGTCLIDQVRGEGYLTKLIQLFLASGSARD
jgi:hypothetical protein